MSRGALLFGVLAIAVLAGGATLVSRRPASAPATAPPAIVSAWDPTWCGKPLAASNSGDLGDAADCGKLSLTGTAPECLFWAECREERFQIDCSSAGPGRCRCDGEAGLTVPYDPAFCSLDAKSPRQSLHAILDAAAVACRWSKR